MDLFNHLTHYLSFGLAVITYSAAVLYLGYAYGTSTYKTASQGANAARRQYHADCQALNRAKDDYRRKAQAELPPSGFVRVDLPRGLKAIHLTNFAAAHGYRLLAVGTDRVRLAPMHGAPIGTIRARGQRFTDVSGDYQPEPAA